MLRCLPKSFSSVLLTKKTGKVRRLLNRPSPFGISLNDSHPSIIRCLRLTILPISICNSTKDRQPLRSSVSKFNSLDTELGSFLIPFPERLRYHRCFNLLMELGTISILEQLKFSIRKLLKLDQILLKFDVLIVLSNLPNK